MAYLMPTLSNSVELLAKETIVQFRQGDVLIVSVTEIPATASAIHAKGRLILAEGEATGHAHTIEAERATLFSTAGSVDRWLRVHSGGVTTLTHQDHARIELPPGDYRVVRQREYSPGAIRHVAD